MNKSVATINKDNLTDQYLADAGKYMKVNTQNTTMWHYSNYFVTGVEYTLLISAVSVVIGVLLGTLLALMRFSKNKLLHGLAVAILNLFVGHR